MVPSRQTVCVFCLPLITFELIGKVSGNMVLTPSRNSLFKVSYALIWLFITTFRTQLGALITSYLIYIWQFFTPNESEWSMKVKAHFNPCRGIECMNVFIYSLFIHAVSISDYIASIVNV
jgi:hypothetical protein